MSFDLEENSQVESRDELSRPELLVLKQIHLTGRMTDEKMALRLLRKQMLFQIESGNLRLTAKGRHVLVRGSPALWHFAQ